ncbi:MAG TPA: LapA family protein [Gaiella sp.]|nr:LapA family protein [Gaiella sp.]
MSDEPRPPTADRPEGTSRDIPWKLVLWAGIALYAIVFLLVNDEKQSVSFVFFTVKTRLVWLILLSMALGAALAVVGPRWWRSRKR